jgi:hypothetical protein
MYSSESPLPLLARHKLSHLRELTVDPSIFEARFAAGCSMTHCNATCCRYGVMVDPMEKENILAHADLVRNAMDEGMEKDPAKWFEDEEEIDLDFPSGRAVGTRTTEHGCVFLDPQGRCILQHAAVEAGMSKFTLKPFFCFAFPITLDEGKLTVDDPDITGRKECCSMVLSGELSVLAVCEEELIHVLGNEGFEELKELVERKNSQDL